MFCSAAVLFICESSVSTARLLASRFYQPQCMLCSPLSQRLGMITEQIAMYTNDSIGGLLNAT